MEVKPGYKQTEVGIIPEGWDVDVLASILQVPIQNGLFNDPRRKGRGCKLINVINLYSSVPIATADLERFDATRQEINRFGVKDGDIFFTRSSLTPDGIAHCNVYERTIDEEIVFDSHIIRVRPNEKKADSFFLARYCTSRPARLYLTANAKTTTMTTVDQGVIARMPVPCPKLNEQKAIAAALSDVEGLLGGLDRLIAKKRELKKAAMQQLLTGQTRLPGFQGEWEQVELRSLFKFKNGLNKGKEFFGYGTPIVNYMDVFGCSTIRAAQLNGRVSLTPEEIQKFDVKKGDVFFTRTSETAEEVGFASVMLDEPNETVFSGFVLRGRPINSRLSDDFKAYCFKSEFVRKQIIARASYTTRALTNGRFLSAVILPVPSLREQIAIADALTDMDRELAALEQRLVKTRALKQAMMQELLTGKTRLVSITEATHA